MSEPQHYAAVPTNLIEGLEQLGSPPSGGGRLRVDMSVNVWTILALLIVLSVALLAIDRLNTQVEIQGVELKGLSEQQKIMNERLLRVETGQVILRRDLRSFPLHRHSDGSRVEIFPPNRDEEDSSVRNR